MKIQRILLATDFSPCARSAYVAAAEIAHRFRARVELVHVLEWQHREFALLDDLPEGSALEDLCQQRVARMRHETATPVFRGLEVDIRLLGGHGAGAVCAYAETSGADLVVLASHGYSGFKHFVLGSFAERVVRHSPVPVLVFKDGPRGQKEFQLERILFPCDFSPLSLEALDAIRLLGRVSNPHVTIAHVWKNPPYRAASGRADTRAAILGKLQRFGDRELDHIDHECRLLEGDPASLIVAAAEAGEMDVICMATHGWTGLRHMLLGSVAEKVVRGARCPVLTVRPHEEKFRVSTDYLTDPKTFLAGWPPR